MPKAFLKEHTSYQVAERRIARAINAAFDDPAPDVPAEQVFAKLEQQFTAETSARTGVTAFTKECDRPARA